MTLKEWLRKQVACGENEFWAVYEINVPDRFIFRDTAFGPMRNKIPDDVQIDAGETDLKLKDLTAIQNWMS